MIRIFSGTDSFESYSLAKKQAEKLAADNNEEIKILNANEIDNPAEFIQYIEGVGMFSGGYIVFLKRLSGNKKLLDYFSDNYDKLKIYNIILWEESKLDGRLKFFLKLKKDNGSFTFDLPNDRDLKAWLNKEAKDKGIKFSDFQLNILIENLGIDKWRLINELEKISIYLSAEQKDSLGNDEFNKIVGFEVSGDIWKLVDAFSNRRSKECLEEYSKISSFEDNGQYIIAMMERELSNLALLHFAKREGLQDNEIGMHPFVLQKLKAKVRNFSLIDINKYLKKLFDLDRSIKNGDIDEKVGLSLYILSL
ncbi:MAG: DNA polymerase III subunit delta [Candidatus Dojkabacteria bacterium]